MKTWYNRPAMQDRDFWTHDIALFDGVFRYYHSKPRPVRGKIHLAEERYFEKHEIIPLTTSRGTQTYVMLHPLRV